MAFALRILLTAVLLGAAAAWSLSDPKAHGDDLVQDYLSARAWLRGEDPYQDLVEMRRREGFPPNGGEPLHHNPHPPLAVLLTAPFAWLPFPRALLAVQGLQVLALAIAWNWAWRRFGRGGWAEAAAGGLLGLWSPVWQGLDWGQPVGLIALGTAGLWALAARGAPASCGAALGALCTLRPFFAIVSAAGMAWPVRSILVAGLAAGLAAGGVFALAGVAPWDWLRASMVASRYTAECGSLPGVLGVGTAGGVALYLGAWLALTVARRRGLSADATVALAMGAGLLTYPLAWFQYDVALVPVLVWLLVRAHERNSRAALLALALFVMIRAVPNLGAGSLAQMWGQVIGRAVLLAGLVCGVWERGEAASRERKEREVPEPVRVG